MPRGTNYVSTNLTGTTTVSSATTTGVTYTPTIIKQFNGSGWVTYNPLYGSVSYQGHVPPKMPDKIVFQDKRETVIIKYGNKATVVKTHDDAYDREIGFLLAFFHANSGMSKNKGNKFLASLKDRPAQDSK